MKVKEFEAFVAKNARMPLSDIAYSFVGLAGETGEVMEWYKKAMMRNDPKYTEDMLLSELGDVVHYVSRIAQWRGWTLKDIMSDNVSKLKARDAAKSR